MMLRALLRHTVTAVLVILASGCAPDGARTEVVFRLGPAAFGRGAATGRPTVLAIADEARPVVDAPAITVLAERRAIPIRDGRARFTVQLGPEARTMPDDDFLLAVKHVHPAPDGGQIGDEIEVGAAAIHFVRRDSAWRLLRPEDDPSRVTIEVDEPGADPAMTLAVQIQSTGRAATDLVSEPFVVPPGARLLLGFAVARPLRDTTGTSTFRADLTCEGRPEEVLLEERLAGEALLAARWHDASFELPRADDVCRLRLRIGGPAGDAGSGVWAIPLVLGRAARGAAARRNVVLISLDTLRADHLSAYGYPRATSPHIDARLAARGALFEDVSTTYPLTSPGHMSLMTGLFAGALPRPGAIDPWTPAMMLAEALRDAGYFTGAYTEDALLAGIFGFWFGFDRFVERPVVGEARGAATFADGAHFLRRSRGRRFFLFLHTYKVHAPYVSSAAYAGFAEPADWSGPLAGRGIPLEQRSAVDAYDRAIREADDQVAAFLAELDRLGLGDDTYVVLLSDHGEAFGEHGLVGHGFGGHQEQLRIPLILRGPGVPSGRRIAAPASIADVMPTLLDLLGLPPIDAQGRSLRPALDGNVTAEPRALPFSWIGEQARGVRHGSVKLLEAAAQPPLLFDLARDPGERHPLDDATLLAAQRAVLAAAADVDHARRSVLAATGEGRSGEVATERMMESLRALGYVQ